MVDAQRARKMADRIHEIVARRLERGIKDPRLGFVTITDVKVTGDLQHASVFYTVYGTDEERRDTGAALKSATGMLRSEVGKNITARLTPSLEFILDALPENAASIDRLLQEARQRDHESQTMASSAEYAGDADPYVKPRDADDDVDGGEGGLDDDLALDDELGAPAAGEPTEPDGSTR
ncbi:30S ribosome-binding factor RbfA [Frigoribacterium sp. PhB24]|uniref:30S ribosome-binding factor RbfA n=1 Tax=Frigoribacterium sp. PhB24 TaxID=2485204 RepID=UPI000F470ECD|nr:30S ribosome-binding factor RbfA [Frigoribacterium sp. PhB24]ROS54613.1 ribosome-binding factor A [Frigoribacterium sp. PhB24]